MNNNLNNQYNGGSNMNSNLNNQYNGINNNFNSNNLYNNNSINQEGKTNKKNNKLLKSLLIVGVVLFVVIILLNAVSKSSEPSAKKILTCTFHHAFDGIYGEEIYKYYINDGSVSVKIIKKYDLEKMEFEGGTGDEWAKQAIEELEDACNSQIGIKCDSKHVKGKSLEVSTLYEEEYWGDKFVGKTADEIYNSQKTRHINGEVDGQNYTCE